LSDNSIQKKDRKFFFRRKGEMQGTSAPPLLTIPRLTNTVIARVPNPPARNDFYFIELAGPASTFIVIETETNGEVTVELTSIEVSDIITAIEAATACTVAFSNRLLTIYGTAADNWIKIKPYTIDPAIDAARALGFAYGEFFPAYSKEGWDAPAPGKNKETFVQRYENNISAAVNRGLSALASNIEEHHRFLSEELVVPKFINTVENPGSLTTWEDGGLIRGLKLLDRAYISDIKNHSPASLEKFFVLTDKFGACSVTIGDREEPVRICDVTTGEPSVLTVPRRVPYFDALGATTEYAAVGDGNSVIGLQKQASEGLIGDFIVFTVVDNSKIRVIDSTESVYPGCRVVWPGDDLNSGEYTVLSVDADIIELLPTSSGRDSLTADTPAGGAVSIYHSTSISVDVPLYLLFDNPVSADSIVAQRGFGLLYGAKTTVKDFLTTTLMGNLKGQAVSDIVIRSLQAIRGPNSRNYRSTKVGDPDGYDGDIDTAEDGGDLISLETLASRSLLGRDVFDLSGGKTTLSLPQYYTFTDGSRANSYAGTPLTLYGEVPPVIDSFTDITGTEVTYDDKWNRRLGGPGPFKGVIVQGGILESDGVFLPTDVGLTVKLSEDEVPAENQKHLLRVWTVSKYINPDKVLLTCQDLPAYYAVASLDVDFTFGTRDARNLSAGALLRLDKTTKDNPGFDGAKVNALVLADTSGVTGVVTLTPVEHSSIDFEQKNAFSTSIANHLELDIDFATHSSLIYQLHPQDKDNPLVTSLVLTSELVGLPAGSWSTEVVGGSTEVTFTHTPVMGATVVEIVSTDGTFDGLVLVRKVQISPNGKYILHLCDFALNDVTLPAGTVGRCRLFNLNVAHALRSADNLWAGDKEDSLAFSSFFGTGKTFGGTFTEENATVARFGGSGKLNSVVEVRATGESQIPSVFVPRTGLSVWASSPSQGIEVNTFTAENPNILNAVGGTGLRVVSFTGFRAHVEQLAGKAQVHPGTAAIIATQLYDADHAVRNDPVKRDAVAVFATQVKTDSPLPNATVQTIVPTKYDTNAQVISYVHNDVYQRSDDRAKWAVTIFADAQAAETSAYLKIYSNTAGYLDYSIVMTEGAVNSVVVNPGLKQLQITLKAGLHYTAAQLATAINATDEFSAEISDGGAWPVNTLDMPGSGTPSTAISEFAPSSIIQNDINNAIEAIQGDVVVTDGIFVIKGESRLTGVGSHLIPVNPEVPVQPLEADADEAIDPATGYDLGEEKILYEEYTTFTTGITEFVPTVLLSLDERNINRKVTFTNFAPASMGETITRYITGINGTAYTLNMPIVFSDWSGESETQSGTITVYGRRWRNIYAQNLEVSTLSAELIENLTVENLTVENVNAESINVENLRVSGVRRKFIPASDFTAVLDTNAYLKFEHVKTLPSRIGWTLDVAEETTFNPATTAKLLYCWSPEISHDTYDAEGHTPADPLKYEITSVTAHYRYMGSSDLAPIDISGAFRDYAMVSIRTHFYTSFALNDANITWFAGGYDLPIDAGSAQSQAISNAGFDGVPGVPPFPIATFQNSNVGNFAGYFSFEIVLRPQLVFSGLTITYRKVAI
jgi:hypothetical protein